MKRRYLKTGMLVISGFMLSSCFGQDLSDAPEFIAYEIENFNAESKIFTASNGWTNGSPFDCYWTNKNVKFENGEAALTVSKDGDNKYGGELKSNDHFGYGYYSVKMKPAKAPGTCSAFFVYTGESEGNPWDEVDIEFLGSDTTRVQFNYFTNGKGGNEHWYDLGFDASVEYHEYGFVWSEESIIWYVDKEPVYKATNNIPSTPGRIIMNTWCGDNTASAWMGNLTSDFTSTTAYYDQVNFAHLDGSKYEPVINEPEKVIDPEDFTWTSLDTSFGSTDRYTVTNQEDGKINVTYSNMGGSEYKNINTKLPKDALNTDAIRFKVKNNGTEEVSLRIDVNDYSSGTAKCINTVATQDGTEIRTDNQWGGSFATLAPNEETEVIVKYLGKATELMFMIDSSVNDQATRSGDITFSNFELGDCGENSNPVEPDNPTDPEEPVENPTDVINPADYAWETLDTTFTSNDVYTVTAGENGSYTIAYTNIAGNSYRNIFSTLSAEADAGNKDAIRFKVKNNGTSEVNLRIDVNSYSTGSAKCLNVLATGNGVELRTDTVYGGSFATIAAGKETEIIVKYTGNPSELMFMIDSSVNYSDSTLRSGNITISSFEIGDCGDNEYVETPVEPDDPTDPEEPVENPTDVINPADYTWGTLGTTFASTDVYTVTSGESDSYTVAYTDVAGNSYKNIVTTLSGEADAGNKDAIRFKVKNNGTSEVNLRIDINSYSTGSAKCLNVLATGNGVELRTDTVYGGSFATIAAGKETEIIVKYTGNPSQLMFMIDSSVNDTTLRSGSITISSFEIGDCGDNEYVETPVEPDDPTDPSTPWEDLNLSFTNDAEYVIAKNDDSLNVQYTDIKGNSYKNMNAVLPQNAKDATAIRFKVKNNGEAAVNLRIDINVPEGEQGSSANTKAINTSATQDGIEIRTDTEWGGSYATIEPNAESEIVVNYKGNANTIMFMIDSSVSYDDETLRSGNITFSGFEIATNTGSDDTANPEEPSQNEWVDFNLNIDSNDIYNVFFDETTNSHTITYTDVVGNSYKNVYSPFPASTTSYNHVQFKVKNNGDSVIKARVDVNAPNVGEGTSVNTRSLNLSATQDGIEIRTDTEWGGSFYEIQPSQESIIEVVYSGNPSDLMFYFGSSTGDASELSSGSVTISEAKLLYVEPKI